MACFSSLRCSARVRVHSRSPDPALHQGWILWLILCCLRSASLHEPASASAPQTRRNIDDAAEVVALVRAGERLAALARLKAAGVCNIGQRQQLVNQLQKHVRDGAKVDIVQLSKSIISSSIAGPPLAQAHRAVHIFGDSHTHTLVSLEHDSHLVLAYPFVAGSAMGLQRSDSRAKYGAVLERDLSTVPSADHVVLKFGQVDIDFVYYLKLVDQPELPFDAFARDSVRKYMAFVRRVLALRGGGQDGSSGGGRLLLMSPHPTVVTDDHLRDSLCTLPFMTVGFRRDFRAKLDAMRLPSMAERTSHGSTYCAMLVAAAAPLGVPVIDAFTPLLRPDGSVAARPNTDRQHHLLAAHVPSLLPALDAALGGRHTAAANCFPAVWAGCRGPDALGGADAAALHAAAHGARDWLRLYGEISSGAVELALRGHVRCSFDALRGVCGPPSRWAAATEEGPAFAAWVLRFREGGTGGATSGAAEGSRVDSPAPLPSGVLVQLKGRFCSGGATCVWEVEAGLQAGLGLARALAERATLALAADGSRQQSDGQRDGGHESHVDAAAQRALAQFEHEFEAQPECVPFLLTLQRSQPALLARLLAASRPGPS